MWILPVALHAASGTVTRPATGTTRGHCVNVTAEDWEQKSKSWQGIRLMAFASWCSSCREALMATQKAPEKFIFLSVFEDPRRSEEALTRLGLKSQCIYGEGFAEKLGIKDLPWSKKI
jgi:hypothetical protein